MTEVLPPEDLGFEENSASHNLPEEKNYLDAAKSDDFLATSKRTGKKEKSMPGGYLHSS